MQWSDEPGGGFTADGATPWLPFGDLAACNVAAQREDPASTLHLVRDLIALRKSARDLTAGAYETLPAPAGAWAWRRGDRYAVAVNLSGGPVAVDGVDGRVAIATDRGRDGEAVSGAVALGPWEAVVVELGG
jgi:alpha-glucosidase